jgi:hypothetical protein
MLYSRECEKIEVWQDLKKSTLAGEEKGKTIVFTVVRKKSLNLYKVCS